VTFTELYTDYETNLRGFAISLTHDPDRADDLVQETFVRAMGHLTLLGQLNHHKRRAWLNRTLKNRFIDEQRREQRGQVLLEQVAAMTPVQDFSAGQIVGEILDAMPDQYRDVFYQRYMLGLNSAEIAADLGIPAATVRSRLHLARKWARRNRELFLE
jgi:RNA polymerase sigma-70 factor (ECF subfamily)